MVGGGGPPEPVWCQSTILPLTTLKIAVARWPGPSHWLCARSPSRKVAVAVSPLPWIERIRPEHGRAAFQATASPGVRSGRTLPAWATLAAGANILAAVRLASVFVAAL